MILMNDFKKEYQTIEHELEAAIKSCLASGWYILGKQTQEFEKRFAEYVGTQYAIGVANGLEALQISLMAVGVKAGDEVLTVANSAVATTLAITNLGAIPVFVDVDEYYHMDVEDLKNKITPKSKAILPVHLFGQMADVESIAAVAKENQLYLIEDACQAHGARLRRETAGSSGELGCFSFYPTKNLGAYGDAGAITTNSREFYDMCLMLRNYGQVTRYKHEVKGLNSRLDELQATILNVKLNHLDNQLKQRNHLAKIYLRELGNVSQIKLPKTRDQAFHSYHLFVIQAEHRDQLQDYLKTCQVESLIHYPIPIHKQPCYPEFNSIQLTKTEDLAKSILSLPIHPNMEDQEAVTVCNLIKDFYAKDN